LLILPNLHFNAICFRQLVFQNAQEVADFKCLASVSASELGKKDYSRELTASVSVGPTLFPRKLDLTTRDTKVSSFALDLQIGPQFLLSRLKVKLGIPS